MLDEVLAVGDEAFQRKCNDFFTEIKKDRSKTVILVTHSMESVKRYCNKAILIKDGEIVVSGNKDDVADHYTLENLQVTAPTRQKTEEKPVDKPQYPTGLNERVPYLKVIPRSPLICSSSNDFDFDVEYEFHEECESYLAIALHDIKRGGISYDSGDTVMRITRFGRGCMHFRMPLNLFNNGQFRIVVSLRVPSTGPSEDTDMVAFTNDDNSCTFVIQDQRNKDYALLSDRAMTITRLPD